MSVEQTTARPRPRFRDVRHLEPGNVIRHDGTERVVSRVERSPDGYHWRVYLVDSCQCGWGPPSACETHGNGTPGHEQLVIVPNSARFTIVAP
jgi:hypothetical protein